MNRHIARAGLIVSAAFLASRVLGWLRTVVVVNAFAHQLGDLDAFFAAFRFPDLIFQLVAAGALSSALIPIVSGLFATDAHERAWRVVSTVANLVLVGLLVLAVVVFVAAPVLVPLVTQGFTDPHQRDLTIDLTRVMLLSPIFMALGAVATSVLNAAGKFAVAAIAPIIYNLGIIGGAVFLAPSMGVNGLAVGVVVGALGLLLVQIRPLTAIGYRWRPVIDLGDPEARRALGLMAPRAVGLGAGQITFVVVTSLATTLGAGAVTSYNIAFTLLQIPIGIIGVPLGVVVFPALSREAAVGRDSAFLGLLDRALRVLVYVMVPIGLATVIVRRQIVGVLFGYGLADSALDQTSDALVAFLVGLPAHALIAVLARAFYARQDTITPVLAAVLAVVVNTTLATLLVGPLGLPGIALAIAIAAWVEALALIAILQRRIIGFGLGSLVRTTVVSVAGGLAASAVAVGALSVSAGLVGPTPGKIGMLVQMLVVGAAFGATYLGVSLALRLPELPSIVGIMADALRPRRS